jgi:DNA invertase Pin-like site-specific DNA recombinase
MPDKKLGALPWKKMIALFKKSHSIRSIARDTDRSRSQVYRVLRAAKLIAPAKRRKAVKSKAK